MSDDPVACGPNESNGGLGGLAGLSHECLKRENAWWDGRTQNRGDPHARASPCISERRTTVGYGQSPIVPEPMEDVQ